MKFLNIFHDLFYVVSISVPNVDSLNGVFVVFVVFVLKAALTAASVNISLTLLK